jgi:hypothetical protein
MITCNQLWFISSVYQNIFQAPLQIISHYHKPFAVIPNCQNSGSQVV